VRALHLVNFDIGFRFRNSIVYQLQLTKRLDAALLTRDCILNWECQHNALKLEL